MTVSMCYTPRIFDRVRSSCMDPYGNMGDTSILPRLYRLHANSPLRKASGALIDGCRVVGMPGPHQRSAYHDQRSHSVGTRIYVGNLPYSADNAQLTQLFSPYGDIVEVRVITDRASGESKGFAFVEMSTEESASRAIRELNGTMLGDRALRLDVAGERPTGPRSGGSNDRGGYSDRPRRDDRSRDSW